MNEHDVELVARQLERLAARVRRQSPTSVEINDRARDGDDPGRCLVEIVWGDRADEASRIAEAIRKATENPGRVFEVEQ